MEIVKGGYLEGSPKQIGERVSFDLMSQGANLLICFKDLSDEEINQIEEGDIEFKLFYKTNIIVFLAKLGQMQWIGAPFHIHFKLNGRSFNKPEFKEDEGLGLTIFGVEAKNSLVKTNIRLVGLSHDFTNKLFELIDEQSKDTFDKTEYDRRVRDLINYYKAEEMAWEAIASCKIKRD